jgi:hypothetical protein
MAACWMVVVVAACSLPQRNERMTYPERWPSLLSDCSALSGAYALHGENARPSSSSVNSPTLFGLFSAPLSGDKTRVRVEVNSDQTLLSVSAYGGTGPESRITRGVQCIDGSLIHEATSDGCGDGSCSKGSGVLSLNKAADGSMVIHAKGVVRSSDLFFRQTHEYDTLYRFLPAR